MVDSCIDNARVLLQNHWSEINSIREEQDDRIRISCTWLIAFKGEGNCVKTTLSFGTRKSDSREELIDPSQLELPVASES